jgi:hypothetical protein
MDLEMRAASRASDGIGLVRSALRRGLRALSREALDEVHSAAQNWVWREEERLISARHDAFLAKGGCPSCGGHGRVVVWDTADSLSGCYAEYGPCARSPEALEGEGRCYAVADLPVEARGTCTAETRASTGLSNATPKRYRGMGGHDKTNTIADWPWTAEEKRELSPAVEALAAVEVERDARIIEVGRPVRVIRGFKVVAGKRKGRGALPLGLEGDVFWKGENHYGTRVGIRVGEGENEIVWTSLGNVEVVR